MSNPVMTFINSCVVTGMIIILGMHRLNTRDVHWNESETDRPEPKPIRNRKSAGPVGFGLTEKNPGPGSAGPSLGAGRGRFEPEKPEEVFTKTIN